MALATSISALEIPLRCARVTRSRGQQSRCRAFASLSKDDARAKSVREQLLVAVQGTDRGVTCSEEEKRDILKLTEELGEIGKDQVTTGDTLSGTWKLAWTTEKASHRCPHMSGIVGCLTLNRAKRI